jgi:hypothetical protein
LHGIEFSGTVIGTKGIHGIQGMGSKPPPKSSSCFFDRRCGIGSILATAGAKLGVDREKTSEFEHMHIPIELTVMEQVLPPSSSCIHSQQSFPYNDYKFFLVYY